MQLQRNNRKWCDKISGRKLRRADDIDVIPAADADQQVAESLVTAINGTDIEPDDPSTASADVQISQDLSNACYNSVPPAKKGAKESGTRRRTQHTCHG